MTGFCGIISFNDHPPERSLLTRMAERLTHAQHEPHVLLQGDIGLACVGMGAHQPLTTTRLEPTYSLQTDEGKTHAVSTAFAGELYMQPTLTEALRSLQHSFDTSPPHPAETLARAYIQYGAAHFMKPLHGQFAFALWDHTTKCLLLMRDQLGHRPLYYAQLPGALLFATSIRALHAHPELAKQPNLSGLPFYLAVGHAPPGETLFHSVKPVPPGAVLTVEGGQLTTTPYWHTPTAEVTPITKGENAISAELARRLHGIAAMHTQGYERVGVFLEGGLSSSVILALLAELDPNTVVTFSTEAVGGIRSEEAIVVRKMRARFATNHHELPPPDDISQIVSDLLTLYDEPFGDASSVMAYVFSRRIAEHVPLLLVGNGGDELFAGYEDFRVAQIAQQYDRLPDIAQRAIGGAVERLPTRQGFPRRLSQVTATASLSLPDRYLDWVSVMDGDALITLIGQEAASVVSRQYAQAFSQQEPDNMMAALLEITLRTSIPYMQLPRLYYSHRAAGIPIRTPFLDHRLVSFASRLPPSLKLKRGISRYIMRQAFSTALPRRVLESRAEHGLPAPVDSWFRGVLAPEVDALLLGERTLLADLFDTHAIRDMIHAHRAEDVDLGHSLWALFILERWMRHHFA